MYVLIVPVRSAGGSVPALEVVSQLVKVLSVRVHPDYKKAVSGLFPRFRFFKKYIFYIINKKGKTETSGVVFFAFALPCEYLTILL